MPFTTPIRTLSEANTQNIRNRISIGTSWVKAFNNKAKIFIKRNISSLIVNFEDQDREGLTEALKLPYYHGIVKDIVDVNFV